MHWCQQLYGTQGISAQDVMIYNVPSLLTESQTQQIRCQEAQTCDTLVKTVCSSQHGKCCPEVHTQCDHNQPDICGHDRHVYRTPQLMTYSTWVTAMVIPMFSSRHMEAPLAMDLFIILTTAKWEFIKKWLQHKFIKKWLSTSYQSMGERHKTAAGVMPWSGCWFSRE